MKVPCCCITSQFSWLQNHHQCKGTKKLNSWALMGDYFCVKVAIFLTWVTPIVCAVPVWWAHGLATHQSRKINKSSHNTIHSICHFAMHMMLFRCLLLLWQKELQLHRIPCWVLPDILCSTNSPHHYHVHCHASQSLEIFNIYRIKVRIGLQAYIRLTCYFQWFHILEKVLRQRRELLCWCLWS